MKSNFPSRLKEGLVRANMTQIDLSKITGISKSAISQYLSGAFKPKQDRTFVIARALDVDPAWLMGYDVALKPKVLATLEIGKKEKSVKKTDQSETKQKLHDVIDQMDEEDAKIVLQFLTRKNS